MNPSITVIVATHKSYSFPDDVGYLPLHVGSALAGNKDLGILKDDLGDGISELNPYFCELTALNWLKKTNKSNACGLVHYRRYFKSPQEGIVFGKHKIASTYELSEQLKKYDIILPKPRNYVVEDIRKHYANAHYGEDVDVVEQIIKELYPEYVNSFKKVFSKRSLSLYNMFVMSRENTGNYSDWLFSILLSAEKKINYKNYNPFQARVFGRLSEMLLNVWVEHNIEKSRVLYLPVVNVEGENLIKKAYYLLRRKFLKEKMG